MDALLNEPQPVPVHAIAAIIAIIIGTVQLYMKKGGGTHKTLGRIWVGLMLLVSFSSFFYSQNRIMWAL